MFSPFLEPSADVVTEGKHCFVHGVVFLAVAEGDSFIVRSDEDTLAEVFVLFQSNLEGDMLIVLNDDLVSGGSLANADVRLGEVASFIVKLAGEDLFDFIGSHGVVLSPRIRCLRGGEWWLVLFEDALCVLKFFGQLLHLGFDFPDALLSEVFEFNLAVAIINDVSEFDLADSNACHRHSDEAVGLHILAVECLGGFDSVLMYATVTHVEDLVFSSGTALCVQANHVRDFIDSGDYDVFHGDFSFRCVGRCFFLALL